MTSRSKQSNLSNSDLSQTSRNDHAATILEFSVAVVVFFVLIFSTLELARYMAIRGLATKAAQVALAYAQKTEALHLDLRLCDSAAAADRNFCLARIGAYRQARTNLAQMATSIATSAFVGLPGSNSAAELVPFRIDTPYTAERNIPLNVAFIRAGEQAITDDAARQYVFHPTMRYGTIPPLTASPLISSWATIQEQNPVMVQIDVKTNPILPWPLIRNVFTISAAASGYVETPKTTHVPPGLGLPMPPLATTTTTSTSTTTIASTSTSTACTGTCSNPLIWDVQTCSCVANCNPGNSPCDGSCWPDCGGGAGRVSGACNVCDCGSREYCAGACLPYCTGGQVRRGDCSCACPNFEALCDGTCPPTCGAGQTLDTTPGVCACRAACGSGQTLCGGSCVNDCPAGQTLDGSCNCVCGSTSCTGGTFDAAACTCTCPSSQHFCGGACIPNCYYSPFAQETNCACVCQVDTAACAQMGMEFFSGPWGCLCDFATTTTTPDPLP